MLCDGSLPDQMIIDMVEDSYDLVVEKLPRATRERLGWSPGRDDLDRAGRPRPERPQRRRDRRQQRDRVRGRARARRARAPTWSSPYATYRKGEAAAARIGGDVAGAPPRPRRPRLGARVRRRRATGALDVLVNNAGVMALPAARGPPTASRCSSARTTSATSRSPGLLLDRCSRPRPRVVTVVERAHRIGRIDFDDLNGERATTSAGSPTGSRSSPTCCSRSSCSAALERGRLAAAQRRRAPRLRGDEPAGRGPAARASSERDRGVGNRVFAQTDAMGALPTLYAATRRTSPAAPTSARTACRAARAPAARRLGRRAKDEAAARRLWEVSEELTGVRYDFSSAARTGWPGRSWGSPSTSMSTRSLKNAIGRGSARPRGAGPA